MKKLLFLTILTALAMSVGSCKSKNDPEPELEPELIAIDGSYKDWDKLIKEKKVTYAVLLPSEKYDKTAMSQINVFVNKTYIYFMILFDVTQAQPLDMFFATKGEVPTNAINLWNPCYVDYCIEFGKGDTFVDDPADFDWGDWQYQQLMAYDHAKGGWNWTNLAQNMVTLSSKTVYNGSSAVEGRIARSNFEFTTTYFYIGAYISDSSWKVVGAQPAATIQDELVVLPEMLKVTLP